MEDIKILVFDIDGTLIPFKAEKPSKRTIKILNQLAKDYIIVCATGRHRFEIDCIKDINFDAYITSDGKVIKTKDKEYQSFLNKEDVKAIVDYVKRNDLACMFNEVDDRYINKVNDVALKYHELIAFDIPRTRDIEYALNRNIVNVTIFEKDEVISDLMQYLKASKAIRWNCYGANINDINAGKDVALLKLCKHYNISPKNVLCFGDGNNDVAMFKCCGHSCAMGNARPKLKDVAEYVSSDIRRSGLVNGLKYFKIIKEDENVR